MLIDCIFFNYFLEYCLLILLSVFSRQVDWAVPHQIKLKYTQIFNTTDRARTGFLSGAQARNVMVQTKLPQNILAQIW